jgi:hypothetical protein
MVKKVERWEASDGQIFEDQGTCERWERVVALKRTLKPLLEGLQHKIHSGELSRVLDHLAIVMVSEGLDVVKRSENSNQ